MAPVDKIATIVYVCLTMAWTSVALRTFVRHKWLDVGLRLDDYTMLVALLFYTVFCATAIALTVFGRNNPVLTEPSADTVLRLLAVIEGMFLLTSVALKISLTIFFRQFLLGPIQRRLLVWITSFYCVICFIIGFVLLFMCGAPIHLASKHVNNKCLPTNVVDSFFYLHGAMSTLSDWIFALLPIVVLWRSMLPPSTKLCVSLLMILAVCGSLCAVLRTTYATTLHFDARYYDPQHPTYYHVIALGLNVSTLEMGIGITAASVACLMPLFRRCAAISSRRRALRLEESNSHVKNSTPEYWDGTTLPRTEIVVLPCGAVDMKKLGILPTVDPFTGEDIESTSSREHIICYGDKAV